MPLSKAFVQHTVAEAVDGRYRRLVVRSASSLFSAGQVLRQLLSAGRVLKEAAELFVQTCDDVF